MNLTHWMALLSKIQRLLSSITTARREAYELKKEGLSELRKER